MVRSNEQLQLYFAEMDSELGLLSLVATDKALLRVAFADSAPYTSVERFARTQLQPADSPLLDEAMRQIEQYLSGKRQQFDLAVDYSALSRVSARSTLEQLDQLVGYGQVCTYSELAAKKGTGSARSVASDLAVNPHLLIHPCHRVIKADGTIGEYQAGRDRKRQLQSIEQTAG